MAERSHDLSLVFVINGANVQITTNVDAPLKEAVARALTQSGNTGRPPSEWQVRDVNGVLLDPDRKILDYGFTNGTRLFLSLAVGAGGALIG